MLDNNQPSVPRRDPWNKGRLIGQKRPLKPKDVWSIRVPLQVERRARNLALFNLAIDSAKNRSFARSSLDHLVGCSEEQWRHGEAKRLGVLEIDDQLEDGRLLDGKIGRFFTLRILPT